MFDVDKTPATNEEKNQLLEIVSVQSKELVPVMLGIKVTCFCGKRINVYYHAYRCYFCGIYFCRECASRHFRIEQNCHHGVDA